MVENLRRLNGTDPIPPAENSPYVRGVIESSVQSIRSFQTLAQPIQDVIITGMTEILAPVEAKNRGRWYADRFEIEEWKLNTLATLRGNVKYDDEEGVKETEEAILLRQLAEGISKELEIHLSDLLAPIREIFKRTITTMESGFDNYDKTQRYRRKRKKTGELGSGSTRSTGGVGGGGQVTNLVRPYDQPIKAFF